QSIARQIAVCVNEYFNPDLNLDRRVYAASFLSSIPLALRRLRIEPRYEYVRKSQRLSKLALSFANFMVRAKPRGLDLPTTPGIRLRAALVQRERFRFDSLDPAEIWWVARSFSMWSHPEIKPAVQRVGLESLPPGDPRAWRIWRYLDLDIPDDALRFVARANLVPGVEGWVAEVLHSKPASS